MQDAINQFLDSEWLERQLSENTLAAYRRDLSQFFVWLQNEKQSWRDLTRDRLLHFLAHLNQSNQSSRSQARKLSAIRGFFRYALREKWIDTDPTALVASPKLPRHIPQVLSEAEVERLVQTIIGTDPLVIRDRTMMELLYATGLRITELLTLTIAQVNVRQGVIRVTGKGSKERLVPMGEQAEQWFLRYLNEARKILIQTKDSDIVFLNPHTGRALTRQAFWYRVKYWALRAEIQKPLSPHGLRHAFATHLVNHGADLRVVQLLLGHESLSTTQIYTAVAQARLKNLHEQHHPRG